MSLLYHLTDTRCSSLRSSKVAQQMIRLLFSTYIRSSHVLSHSSREVGELWRLLSKFALRLCHRLTFVENWSTACYCLTRELFFCVSGSEGDEYESTNVDLCVDWGGKSPPIKIITTAHSLKFMWNRMVHLLGNVNRLSHHKSGEAVR